MLKNLKKSVTHGANGTQNMLSKISIMFGQHFYHKQIRNAKLRLVRYLTMLISRDWILAEILYRL